jgi:hypothetical protein
VQFKQVAIELLKARKAGHTYPVRDALNDLGVPDGYMPTINTLWQAIELIKANKPLKRGVFFYFLPYTSFNNLTFLIISLYIGLAPISSNTKLLSISTLINRQSLS